MKIFLKIIFIVTSLAIICLGTFLVFCGGIIAIIGNPDIWGGVVFMSIGIVLILSALFLLLSKNKNQKTSEIIQLYKHKEIRKIYKTFLLLTGVISIITPLIFIIVNKMKMEFLKFVVFLGSFLIVPIFAFGVLYFYKDALKSFCKKNSITYGKVFLQLFIQFILIFILIRHIIVYTINYISNFFTFFL